MPEQIVEVHLNMNKNEVLNARFQNLTVAPSVTAADEGFIYWNTTDEKPYIWTGTAWLDMGSVYTHPSFPGTAQPTTPLTGATVISQITLTNGHVTNVVTRNLSPGDIGAALTVHTHAFNQITGLPTNTMLGNATGSTGPAQALTQSQVLSLMGIAYGTAALLTAGADTSQRTWQAKDISDFVNSKLSTYLTVVNLALGTRTATTMPITNTGGTGVTLPVATTTLAGLLSAADKLKLDGIAAGANMYVHPTNNPGTHPFSTLITSGLLVLSQLVVNNEGHTVGVQGRNLTAADIASVMINDAINNGVVQTWSSNKIYTEIQAAINQAQTGALIYQGNYNPVTNTPNITTNTNVKVGWTYVVDTAGTFAGQVVESGDMIIAKVDNPGSTPANWQIVNKNIPAIVDATTLVKGIVRLATITDYNNNDNTTAVTPALLKQILSTQVTGQQFLIGNGSTTTFPVTHALNTTLVIVQVQRVSDGAIVLCETKVSSATVVTVAFNNAPSNNAYRVIITPM